MTNTLNKQLSTLVLLASTLTSSTLFAGVETETGLLINLQHSSDSRVDGDAFASFDFSATIPQGPGAWSLHLEANTDIRDDQVSGIIGEANADAGSAIDARGNGRVQVSELFYSLPAFNGDISIGLIDATGTFDGSDVANDEGSQFVGSSFVNNPTIGFPDYTLGTIYSSQNTETKTGYSLTIMSSHGLGDNEHASYEELFHVSDDGKGVFIAGEYNWSLARSHWRAGIWTNTAKHDHLDGNGKTDDNYGVYVSTDIALGENNLNLRAGLANKDVSEASNFVAVSYQTNVLGNVTGFGLAHTGASNELAGAENTLHAEAYSRFDINDHLQITPNIQWIKNSGFDDSNSSFDDKITIIGVRANISF